MSSTTQEILDRHMEAFLAGDLDAVMADYADDAVMISPNGTRTGAAEIREAFAGLFAGLFAPGNYTFHTDQAVAIGDVAYVRWHAECPGVTVPIGSDTLVVRDGLIVAQTVALMVTPTAGTARSA